MSNIISNAENGPIDVFENRPSEQLDHGYGPGKPIPPNLLEELALEKYQINGKGITFEDIIKNFTVKRKKLNFD